MPEPSPYGYRDEVSVAPNPQQTLKAPGYPEPYKFSPEELRTIKDCNQESFFKRSLPLGTLLGFGTFSAVQAGYLKPNPRFGVFPKVSLAVVVGYFLGKLSYQQACAEKLMALPGSYIGQLLRDRREGKISGGGGPARGPAMFGAGPGDIYSDAGPGSALDLDTDRPAFNDDTYRPDLEGVAPGAGAEAGAAGPGRPALSYDELRRRNRGEFNDARQDPYKVEGTRVTASARTPAAADAAPARRTNEYGDVVE